jgi:hypothetical protein
VLCLVPLAHILSKGLQLAYVSVYYLAMGVGKLRRIPAAVAFGVASVGVVWSPFASTIYPYSISQPSSFRHIVIRDTADVPVDYFFPSLGSSTTNLHIKAVPGHETGIQDEVNMLRDLGGHHVRRTGWIRLAGQRLAVLCADFNTYAGQYTIERVSFTARGLVWNMTASYDLKYRKKIRPTLLRMMRSFRLR